MIIRLLDIAHFLMKSTYVADVYHMMLSKVTEWKCMPKTIFCFVSLFVFIQFAQVWDAVNLRGLLHLMLCIYSNSWRTLQDTMSLMTLGFHVTLMDSWIYEFEDDSTKTVVSKRTTIEENN